MRSPGWSTHHKSPPVEVVFLENDHSTGRLRGPFTGEKERFLHGFRMNYYDIFDSN